MDLLHNVIVGTLLIFVVRVFSVTLSTIRLLIMGRANKLAVSGIAFVEALTFALTFGVVASDLTNLWFLMSYCGGFAGGTWIGTMLEERIARGFESVNIVSTGKSLPIAEAIRAAGYGATRTTGEGSTGTVGLIYVVARRKDIPTIIGIANDIDPKAFITVESTRSVQRGWMGIGRS